LFAFFFFLSSSSSSSFPNVIISYVSVPFLILFFVYFPFLLKLVQLVGQDGCKDLNLKEQINSVPALKVAETWQKMHNGKWVIGISVCNAGKR
jgi:hypothetical protein